MGLRIALLGDVALNGRFADTPADGWRVLDTHVDEAVRGADLVVFNLETPVAATAENELKSPRIKTTEAALDGLPKGRMTVATLANNHAYDCLEDGFAATVAALDRRNIGHVGAGATPEQARFPRIIEVEGCKIGILAYNDPSTHPSLPSGIAFTINTLDERNALADVSALAARCDAVIVSLHWGVDYLPHPAPSQVRLATALIAAGARVVFGHHAHVVQGVKRVGGGVILFGLGNTCFYPDEDIEFNRVNRVSLAAVLEIRDGYVGIEGLMLQERDLDGLHAHQAGTGRRAHQAWLNTVVSMPLWAYRIFFPAAKRAHQWVFRPVRFLFNDRYALSEQLSKITIGRIVQHYLSRS